MNMSEYKDESKGKEDKPLTKEEVEKLCHDNVMSECFANFLSLIKLGYSLEEAGIVVYSGVIDFSEEIKKSLQQIQDESDKKGG
jgi:hypothetical protein